MRKVYRHAKQAIDLESNEYSMILIISILAVKYGVA